MHSAVIARLDRAIQYAAASQQNSAVSGILDSPPSRGMTVMLWGLSAYSCAKSVSPPETSTLPGAGSRLSFFTVPSSTSIE